MSDYRPDIWRLQAQSDVEGLISALGNHDAGIRKRAAAALRALGAARAVPALTDALAGETDADVRAHILAALDTLSDDAQYKQDEAAQPPEQTRIAALIAQLSSAEPERVIAAIRELGESDDKLVVEPLVMLFNNRKQPSRVRLAAADALLKLNGAPAEVTLLGALHSVNWQARRNAAAVLGQLKAEWAIDALGKALADEVELVRRTAFAALKYIATPESLKMLAAYRRTNTPTPATRQTGQTTRVDASAPNAARGESVLKSPTSEAKMPDTPPVPPQTPPPKPQASPPAAPLKKTEPKPAPSATSPSLQKAQPPLVESATQTQPALSPAPAPTSPAQPGDAPPASSGQSAEPPKLTWPKRKPPPALLQPTRPLDPSVVERAQERMKKANEQSDDEKSS